MAKTSPLLPLLALAALLPLQAAADPGGNGKGHKAQEHSNPHDSHGQFQTEHRSPRVDSSLVHQVLDRHRTYLSPASDLPPGIRKKVARGKPLPPGIARKLDSRVIRDLPHYEGYEWRQVGEDLVLITTAGVVYAVLEGMLD